MQVRLLVYVSLLLSLGSCGYSSRVGWYHEGYSTYSTSFATGDKDGIFTAYLVREMSRQTGLCYVSSHPDLCLDVVVLKFYEENIGFHYDIVPDGDHTNDIIPSEIRLSAVAEVTLTDQQSGCPVWGPRNIEVSIEYDHDYYSNHGQVNVFSLGQLNDIEQARELAYRPLFRALAKRIVQEVSRGGAETHEGRDF